MIRNSLIDDKKVAGDKAFKWEEEFPEIFKKGGFDVVIGNPPYVRQELLGDIKPYLECNYHVYEGTSDLFAYFYEKSFKLIKQKGIFGFISNTFDKTKAAIKLRDYLTNNTCFLNYVDFTEVQIFEGATTYPIILTAENDKQVKKTFRYIKVPKKNQSPIIDIELENAIYVSQSSLSAESWNFNSSKDDQLLKKLKGYRVLKEQFGKSFRGIVTGFNDAFIIDEAIKNRLEKEHQSSKELIKPFFEGKDKSKWHSFDIGKYIIFTRRGTDIDKFPAIRKYLEVNRERLTPRNSADIKVGRKPGPYKWFEIQDSVDYYKVFEEPKITWPNLQSSSKFSLESKGYYINAPSVVLPSNSKTLLCVLNSKVTWFFLRSVCVVRSGGYLEVKPQYFEQIPVPELKNEDALEQKADEIIENTVKIQNVQSKFTRYIQGQFSIEKLSKKLQNWYELEFSDFIKELNKVKKEVGGAKLSKIDEMDWMEFFETKKSEAQKCKSEIKRIEKEIDLMVYELYRLTEEEIAIIENSIK